MEYYRTLIKIEGEGFRTVDTITSYGIYCMDIPFRVGSAAKDIHKRSWKDEDGDDEYIPPTGIRMQAYEMTVKFGFKGNKFSANKSISDFANYLRSGMFSIYSEYTRIGRQHVRLSGIDENAQLVRSDDGDILVFSVKMKVNDPVTDIKLSLPDGED